MIWKIKIIVSAIAFIGIAGIIGYGYVKINTLESDLKVAQGQLNEAHNANLAWQKQQKERDKQYQIQLEKHKEMIETYAKNFKDFREERKKVENNNVDKIITKKPSLFSNTVNASTTRLLDELARDSEAFSSETGRTTTATTNTD